MARPRKIRDCVEASAAAASVPPRSQPSLAHDLVLLGIDPDTGELVRSGRTVELALLQELQREARIAVSSDRHVTVTVVDRTPLGDPDLDEALATIVAARSGAKVVSLLPGLPDVADVLRRMVASGEVREEKTRRWGLLPATRYVVTSPATREALVARVRSALTSQAPPDARTAHLVALARLTLGADAFVDKAQAKEARQRAETIAEEQQTAADAQLLKAIQQAQAHSNDAGS